MTEQTSPLDRFTYWAVSAVVDRMVDTGPADSVREGWYEADCLCGWHTSGNEPNVEDAAHDHVGEKHGAQVQAEKVILAAARAYCEAKSDYDPATCPSMDDRERHIAADAASHARGEPFRAAVKAAVEAGVLAADGDTGVVVAFDAAAFEMWRQRDWEAITGAMTEPLRDVLADAVDRAIGRYNIGVIAAGYTGMKPVDRWWKTRHDSATTNH